MKLGQTTIVSLGAPLEDCADGELTVAGSDSGHDIFLHVYDLHPLTKLAGLPLYHTGVQVHGWECSYSSLGLQWVQAEALHTDQQELAPGYMGPGHREVVPLGSTPLTARQVVQLMVRLSEEWRSCDYNIFHANCQTFSLEFCRCLGVSSAIPPEFVRFAKWGDRLGG